MSASCGDDWETSRRSRGHFQGSLRRGAESNSRSQDEIEFAADMNQIIFYSEATRRRLDYCSGFDTDFRDQIEIWFNNL